MYKKSDLFYTVLHLPVDILAVVLAFIVSYWLRGNGLEIYKLPYADYLSLVYAAAPLWVVIFALQGLYMKRYLFGTLQNMLHVALSVLAGWASFVVYLVFLKNEQTLVFPRLMLIYILIFGFLFVFCGRLLLRLIQFAARTLGIGRRRIILLGSGKLAETMEEALLKRTDPGINFIKRIEPMEVSAVIKSLKQYKVDELIIADHGLSPNKILEYIIEAQNIGVECQWVPNMFEVQASNVLYSTLVGMPLLTFRQTPLEGWGRIAKRVVDIVLASIGLIVLSPLFLVVALIIQITDPGPILYSHKRITRGGRSFYLLKFRSMIARYCAGPGFSGKGELEIYQDMGRKDLIEEFKRDHKVKDDPRISRFGKFMRKTRLDELPQLINVLRGDLSLVGPRPIVSAELEKYGRRASYLLSIKPGLTGLWQVSGGNDISYEERVELDAQYVQNWSLWQDFVIIVKTFFAILRGGDGY